MHAKDLAILDCVTSLLLQHITVARLDSEGLYYGTRRDWRFKTWQAN